VNLDWEKYTEVADRFQRKAKAQDREDLRHNIILALAEQYIRNSQNGNKPLSEFGMLRIASHTVADYYRQLKRNGKVVSLNTEIDDGEGYTVELIDTLADDGAIDVEAWLDAKVWLLGCPKRLVGIAHKRVKGIPLSKYEQLYLCRFWKRSQKTLLR